MNDTVGPRGLQTLIKDRMKHGVCMPFKISIRKHSRLALVGWEAVNQSEVPEEGGEISQNPVSKIVRKYYCYYFSLSRAHSLHFNLENGKND